jgi:hypothetical protein
MKQITSNMNDQLKIRDTWWSALQLNPAITAEEGEKITSHVPVGAYVEIRFRK